MVICSQFIQFSAILDSKNSISQVKSARKWEIFSTSFIIDTLNVTVTINGKEVARNTSAGMHFSISEAIAYASWEEQLYPGEFFGSGTIPLCTGMENGVFLHSNDSILLEIEGIGRLYNKVK